MPVVIPKPLPSLADVVDDHDERLRSTESVRFGVQGVVNLSAPLYVTTSATLTIPPGWPTLTFQLGPRGLAMIGAQCQAYTTVNGVNYGVPLGGSLDSGSIVSIGSGITGSNSVFLPVNGFFMTSGTPNSIHTFQIACAASTVTGIGNTTFGQPFMVAKPF